MQKGFAPLYILISLAVVATAIGAYVVQKTVNFQPKATQQPVVSQPQPTRIPQPTIDPTADWKTYTNNEFGYSIKLPFNWRLSKELSIKTDKENIEKFTSLSIEEVSKIQKQDAYNPSYYLEIEIKDNPGVNINEWASDSRYSPQGADQKITETLMSGIPSVQVLGNQGQGYVDYYLYNQGKIYNLGYYYLENDPTWERPPGITKETFDQILSNFKFLPDSPAGGDETSTEGKFCGGIAANLPQNQCPDGYRCQLEGNYPDAGGKCVKK